MLSTQAKPVTGEGATEGGKICTIIVILVDFEQIPAVLSALFTYGLGSHEIFAATQLSVSVYVPRPILLSYKKKIFKFSFLKKRRQKYFHFIYKRCIVNLSATHVTHYRSRWPTTKYAATQFWVATHGLRTQDLRGTAEKKREKLPRMTS